VQKPKEKYVRPSLQVAETYANTRHPRKYAGEDAKFTMYHTTTGRHCCVGGFGEQCDLFGEGQVSEFGQFGPGVTNYFKYLKWNIWVFLMLSIFAVIPIAFNYYGPTSDEQSGGISAITRTTAGNLVSITNSSALITIPGCVGYDYNGIDCTITPPELAQIYAYLDIASMSLVLIGYIWLRVYEKKETILLDKSTVNVSDFSVKLWNLPKTCTKEELQRHMAAVTGQQVAAVYFAYDNSKEIKGYRARGKLVQQKYHVRQKKLYYESLIEEKKSVKEPTCCGWWCGYGYFFPCSCKRDYADELKLWAQLDKKNAELGMQIKIKNEELDDTESTEPLFAFVTFEEKIGAITAKALYTTSWFSYLFMEAKHKFQGNRLHIADAPEPSTIIWENLNFTKYQRFQRRSRTAIIAAILILISLLARILSTVVERSANTSAGESLCPTDFNNLSEQEQQQAAIDDPSILHCYCDSLPITEQTSDSLCKEYFEKIVRANVITYFASFLVVAINMVLEYAVNIFSDYEKHHSIDSKGRSVFVRLFWLYVLNSAVVFIAQINTKDIGFIQDITGYAPAPTVINFSSDWYTTIAGGIVIVQLTGPVTIQLMNLYKYWCFVSERERARRDPRYALTQDELNLLHLGPQFRLSVRYAQQLSNFVVCLIFSMGIPLLNVIGFCTFMFSYLVEKFLFINWYRSPPRYNSSISLTATRMIPLAVVVHLIFSIWTLSITEVFQTTESTNALTAEADYQADRAHNSFVTNVWISASSNETFPLFVMLVLVILGLIVEVIAENFFGSVGEAFVAIFGNLCNTSYMEEIKKYNELKRKNLKTKNAITYTRALQRGIFKGLSTYNILQNPYYMESFSISSKFASEHTSVNSLRFTRKHIDTSQLKGPVEASKAVLLAKTKQKEKPKEKDTPSVKAAPKPKVVELSVAELIERDFAEYDKV
jgi:hypothetical protein